MRDFPTEMIITTTCPNCGKITSFFIDLSDYPKIIVEPCDECMWWVHDMDELSANFYDRMCEMVNEKLNL